MTTLNLIEVQILMQKRQWKSESQAEKKKEIHFSGRTDDRNSGKMIEIQNLRQQRRKKSNSQTEQMIEIQKR